MSRLVAKFRCEQCGKYFPIGSVAASDAERRARFPTLTREAAHLVCRGCYIELGHHPIDLGVVQ